MVWGMVQLLRHCFALPLASCWTNLCFELNILWELVRNQQRCAIAKTHIADVIQLLF